MDIDGDYLHRLGVDPRDPTASTEPEARSLSIAHSEVVGNTCICVIMTIGAVRAVLAAWAGRATAVLLDAAAPDSLARTAASQEGAVALAPQPVETATGNPS